MPGTPSTYQSRSGQFRQQLQSVAAQVQAQFPNAWAKARAHDDDGEFIRRLAWASRQAGIPCFLNGKRGNGNDMSLDILTFENPTGAPDRSGRFAGIEIVDVIMSHELPNARVDMLDVTVVENPPGSGNRIMPDGFAIEPTDLGGASGGGHPQPAPTPMPPVGGGSYPGDAVGNEIGAAVFADYAAAGQAPNPGMGTWFFRTAWDASHGMSASDSIAKHRKEWRAALGLPPV